MAPPGRVRIAAGEVNHRGRTTSLGRPGTTPGKGYVLKHCGAVSAGREVYATLPLGPHPLRMSDDGRQLTVVPLNVCRMRLNWRVRRWLIVDELAELAPDVIALQEVATGRRQAAWIARQVARRSGRPYRAWVVRKRGWHGLLEGVAILTPLPARIERLALGGSRVAVAATVTLPSGVAARVYSVHLEHRGENEALRTRQLLRVVAHARAAGVPAIVAGDCNARPDSPTLRTAYDAGYISAYAAANGAEPAKTAPSGPAEAPGNTLDYVLAGPGTTVVDCGIAFAELAPGRPGVFPSDHFGLAARLGIG